MNCKLFITAFVSFSLMALPQNGVSCGPTEDPYDYFTSFFNKGAGTTNQYKPFYYTALLTFYDDWDQDTSAAINEAVVAEWAAYTGTSKMEDVVELIYNTDAQQMQALAKSVRDNKPLPSIFVSNSMATQLTKNKMLEAVDYLVFAKNTEVSSAVKHWDAPATDSLLVDTHVKAATAQLATAADPFVKNKYAFQLCKLAFYNRRYRDCIKWYDHYFDEKNTTAVKPLALAYKAGSLFRTNKNKEAAYAFSLAFNLNPTSKKSNYLGFLWATESANKELIPAYISLCKTNAEKANMLAMFAMHGSGPASQVIAQVHALNPSSPLLPLLATREINKLEEQYFTPLLNKEKGGRALYISWDWQNEDDDIQKKTGVQQVLKTAKLFEKLAVTKNTNASGLYAAGAAYLHFMLKDYATATKLLANVNAATDKNIVQQVQLIKLLIAANETKTITPAIEAQLLPSLAWLITKAKADKTYRLFCRNFFSQILAQRYQQQGSLHKAAMAYGIADLPFVKMEENEYYYSYPGAEQFVQNEMATADLVQLHQLISKPTTAADKFLVQYSSLKNDVVIDVIGTSYLRDRQYKKSIEWLAKAGKLEPIEESQYNYETGNERKLYVDPFYDYINDWQRFNKASPIAYNKLSLAKQLLALEIKIKSGKGDRAKNLYQYASALYNMSYYGNSWNAVAYYRSTVDWNEGQYKSKWEKEYFTVGEARQFYQKAYEAATDKEFKAACLFMVAKCAQRQLPRPAYDYKNYEDYEKAMASFNKKFMANSLFPKFATEFGNTKFYQYVYNRCSYLRDYVKQHSR